MVTHLLIIHENSTFCGLAASSMGPQTLKHVTRKFTDATCKRCLRKFHRVFRRQENAASLPTGDKE